MKTPWLLLLAALSPSASCQNQPELTIAPNSTEECFWWYDNHAGMNKTCRWIADYYNLSLKRFAELNPALGADCENWDEYSYCIASKSTIDEYEHGPLPTSWKDLGCHVHKDSDEGEVPKNWTYTYNFDPSGAGPNATIPRCQEMCYRMGVRYAGVQLGGECWCSTVLFGELAANQSECDWPCAGDRQTLCGGRNRANIFDWRPDGVPSATTGRGDATGTATSQAVVSQTQDSGGRRNLAFDWFF